MRITVTQQNIDNGKLSCELCPIALAINERLDPKYVVGVGDKRIGIYRGRDDEEYVSIPTPQGLLGFIFAFDHKQECAPFSFDLDIPTEYLREAI